MYFSKQLEYHNVACCKSNESSYSEFNDANFRDTNTVHSTISRRPSQSSQLCQHFSFLHLSYFLLRD